MIGESERKVYGLVAAGRPVSKLIDMSCLGEFETCKALCNLVNLDYLRAQQGVTELDGRQRRRLEARWLWEKLFRGTS